MDTFGWDVIYATTIERINNQIKQNSAKMLTSFSFEKGKISISGIFDTWQIIAEGSDKKIRFKCPIKSGQFKITTEHGNHITDLAGVIPAMELQFDFIDDDTGAGVKNLAFNIKVVGKSVGDNTPGAVTTVSPDITGKIDPKENPATWGLLNTYLPEIFIANRDKLSYVFAQVDLGLNDSISWMQPKQFFYAYKQESKSGKGFLCVFTVLTDRKVDGLPTSLDGAVIDEQEEVFVLISNEMFLKNILQPILPQTFKNGATAANFVYKTTGGTQGKIINNGHLKSDPIVKGAETYRPFIISLDMHVENDKITSKVIGDFDITGLAGASVSFTVESELGLAYDTANSVIRFKPTGNKKVTSTKNIPWYDYVAAVFTGGLILAIVDIVISLVTDDVAHSVSNGVASGEKFSDQVLSVISWNGMENLKVTDAGLSQAFFFRGTY